MINKTVYYLYRITNKLNNKCYIGCHSTDNIDDGYMGSGLYINRAYAKYGIENFYKEILNFYPDANTMFNAEKKIVTREFIDDDSNYNLAEGGKGGFKGAECYASAARSGKISYSGKNKVLAKTIFGDNVRVDKNDTRFDTKELVGITKGKAVVKNAEGKVLSVEVDDPRIASGELVGNTKGLAVMKDKEGLRYQVSLNDPRIASGELVGNTKGYSQTDESNKKRSMTLMGITRTHTYVTCVFCKKSTTLTNFIRWHKNCC